MKDNIFLSIIVPVYNTPIEILKSCFDSVKNQTNDNWELIVVDDGSTIDCAKWIDKYCENFQNTSIIHKENEGVSVARNEGVKIAKGTWITFLDSDNTLPIDTVETYYKTVNSNKTDDVDLIIGYSVMGTRTLENDEDIISLKIHNTEVLTKENNEVESDRIEYIEDKNELVTHLLTGNNVKWEKKDKYFSDGPWGKLVRANVAKTVFFPNELKWDEDTIWLLNLVSISKGIIVIPNIVYNNVEYFLSATKRFRQECLQEFYGVCMAEKKMELKFPKCKKAFIYKRFSNILHVSRLYFFHKDNLHSKSQRYKDFCLWCEHRTTRSVAKDVVKNTKLIGYRNLISKLFSASLIFRLYKICWLFLKCYNKRF